MNSPFTSNWLAAFSLTYKKGGQMTSQLEVKGDYIVKQGRLYLLSTIILMLSLKKHGMG